MDDEDERQLARLPRGVWLDHSDLRRIFVALWAAADASGPGLSALHAHLVEIHEVIWDAINEEYRDDDDDG